MAVTPSSPVLAARQITLDPEEGAIGDTITVTGSGFSASTNTTDRYIDIFLTLDGDSTAFTIGNQVKTYEMVKSGVWIDEAGEFETTFDVPDVLNDGSVDQDVELGTTYFICAAAEYTNPDVPGTLIRAYAEFNAGAGHITLNPERGPVGTSLEINGTSFPPLLDIITKYDGDTVNIEDGDHETDNDGHFVSIIIVPESIAGSHTITVTVSDRENQAQFTIEPKITIDPQSGEAGSEVTFNGTGFGSGKEVAVWFKIIGVTTERGSFNATANITPGLGTGDYYLTAEDENGNTARAKYTVIASTQGGCFIATAAYGTDTAKELYLLRQFRDEVLLTNKFGTRFVSLYYTLSPPIADFISRYDVLRTIVREGIIDPIVAILRLS